MNISAFSHLDLFPLGVWIWSGMRGQYTKTAAEYIKRLTESKIVSGLNPGVIS